MYIYTHICTLSIISYFILVGVVFIGFMENYRSCSDGARKYGVFFLTFTCLEDILSRFRERSTDAPTDTVRKPVPYL